MAVQESETNDDGVEISVIVTVRDEVITENGAFETFQAVDHTERSDCVVFFGATVTAGTLRVQKENLRSVVYL